MHDRARLAKDVPNGRPRIDWDRELGRHNGWLRAVVYARIREPDAVDEVMQEVALAAVRQAAPLEDAAKVAPWLYRLAVRHSLLFRRRCGRQRKLLDRYVDRRPERAQGAGGVDPLQWLLADECRAQVRRALEQLARRDREILLLKYAENWTYHQIAAHVGASHSAVEARLHRARRRLRAALVPLQMVDA